MRSPREIAFRVRQEAANASRLFHIPRWQVSEPLVPERILPDPAACVRVVRDKRYTEDLTALADEILRHRFPIFDRIIETGPDIDWLRDYRHDKTATLKFFRRVRYLDFEAVGDHKWTWELNRHQHLIVLAQAALVTERGEFLREIERQTESWIVANPFARGINWASALEVAFRALSWVWMDHLVGDRIAPPSRLRLQHSLWQHARHLEANLSVYFSPNTHLLGEALALYAIGRMYPAMPRAAQFMKTAQSIVENQLEFQVKPDGSHFEQSSYYHVYALDMFLLYYLIAGRPERMIAKLRAMARYLDALAGPSRLLFFSGDDDGGRLFHPYGERNRFCRATLATCANLFPNLGFEFCPKDVREQAAWWIGPGVRLSAERKATRAGHSAFQDAGTVALLAGEIQVLFDAGPLGWGGAGHSHADTLNLLIRRGDEALLDDPGTFTYTTDPAARDWFRGTAAHNTIRIDNRDQADPVMPFRWANKPVVRLTRSGDAWADARCEYRGFTHRRRVLLCGEHACIVLDDVEGPEGEHAIEQFWNSGDRTALLTSHRRSEEKAWRSTVYGSREEVTRAAVRLRSRLPVRLATAILFEDGGAARLETDGATVRVAGIVATFREDDAPTWRLE